MMCRGMDDLGKEVIYIKISNFEKKKSDEEEEDDGSDSEDDGDIGIQDFF